MRSSALPRRSLSHAQGAPRLARRIPGREKKDRPCFKQFRQFVMANAAG
jgi:hypothetical protein